MLVNDADSIAKWVSAQTDFPGYPVPAHGPTEIAGCVTMLPGPPTDMYRVWL